VGEVLEAVSACMDRGSGEIVLCGINLGRYDQGRGKDLACLVREIMLAGEGYRVRLSSIELEDLRMEWLEEWSENGRVCPHLHLPLQSGDEGILRDMGRGYGPDDFLAAADDLRCKWPRAALTTEVIVGYPGESEGAFRHTLEVLEAARPSRVHVFRFSPRPGTKAWGRSDVPSPQVMEARSTILRELAEAWRLGYIEEHRGRLRAMLVEKKVAGDGQVNTYGTTEDFIKGVARGPCQQSRAGEIVTVEIRGTLNGIALLEMAASAG
jgi:threonylcarbamoyladenosine tRNA methylthiotransferase MtaB